MQQASTKTQLEVHIVGLKITESLDAGDDVDIDIIDDGSGGITVGEDSSTVDTGEEEDTVPNASDAFKQFKVFVAKQCQFRRCSITISKIDGYADTWL